MAVGVEGRKRREERSEGEEWRVGNTGDKRRED